MNLHLVRMQPLRRATIVMLLAFSSAPALTSADDQPVVDAATRAHKKTTEFIGGLGGTAGSSAWKGDPVALTTLKLGFRYFDVLGPYFLSRLGYAPINDRSILTLSIGVQAWARIGKVRPYARVAILHQHEESLAAIKADPGGAIVGVGDGIRHRSGPELGIGFDFPLLHDKKFDVVGTVESSALYFPDPRGPSVYVLGGVALGLDYAL